MAYKAKKVPTSRKSASTKGSPIYSAKNKAGIKDPHLEHLEQNQDNAEKYMDDIDNPANNVMVRHPNRGYDKPDIDKPAYN